MKNMTIVFLRSNPVHPDPRVEKEANSLIKAGYNVIVVAWDRSEKYRIKEANLDLENGSAKIYRFGIPATYGGGIKCNLKPMLSFQHSLYKYLSSHHNEYDIIHACDFDTSLTAYRIAKEFKKNLVYDIFDYYVDAFHVPNFLKGIIEGIDHQIINHADAVIICSENRRKQINGTSPKMLEIIHNTPPGTTENKNLYSLNKEKIKIVYIGILDEGRFIREIADFVKGNSKFEYHIGGFGLLEDYFEKLDKEYDNIYFYGKLPYDQAIELESACDIMTAIYDPSIPNHKYAAPNKFYEALMLGKPVIMVENTGMDNIVQEYDIGAVITYSEDDLSEAFYNLAKRKDEWDSMGDRMKVLYKEQFSWNKMEKRLLKLYEIIGNEKK